MHLHIIEDDQNKIENLEAFFLNASAFSDISYSKSFQTALKTIESKKFDLFILDMSMPTFDKTPKESGGRPRMFAGVEILEYLQENEITTPVIIVTQFDTFGEGENSLSCEQLNTDLLKKFSPYYKGLVFYSPSDDRWKSALTNLINATTKK